MTLQRRRGDPVSVYGVKTVTDHRGNRVETPDPDTVVHTRASVIWDRSNRAEIPGYQWVQVFRVIINADLDLAQTWGLVRWRGKWWDIISPPEAHLGRPYHIRSTVALIRERPPGSTDFEHLLEVDDG